MLTKFRVFGITVILRQRRLFTVYLRMERGRIVGGQIKMVLTGSKLTRPVSNAIWPYIIHLRSLGAALNADSSHSVEGNVLALQSTRIGEIELFTVSFGLDSSVESNQNLETDRSLQIRRVYELWKRTFSIIWLERGPKMVMVILLMVILTVIAITGIVMGIITIRQSLG